MGKRLLNQDCLARRMKCLLVLVTLLLPMGTWAVDYDLTVAGIRVTDENATGIIGDMINGTITYDASTNTLTLDGATVNGDMGIWCGMESLTIVIKGENSITCDKQSAIYFSGQLPESALTFVKDESTAGICKLTLQSAAGVAAISGFTSLNYGEGVAMSAAFGTEYDASKNGLYNSAINANIENVNKAVITSATVYDLWYDGEQVTSENAGALYQNDTEVFVSFDAETNTLTFNNSSNEYSGYAVASNLAELNIFLIGNNTISLSENATAFKSNNADAKFYFQTNENQPGSLLVGYDGPLYDGVDVSEDNMQNGLQLQETGDGYLFAICYDLAVNGTIVNSSNRMDITGNENEQGEPTVQFDGESTLILNGANDLESIELIGSMPSLTIYLKGDNTMQGVSIVNYTNQEEPYPEVIFTTSSMNPGTLTFNYVSGAAMLNDIEGAFFQVSPTFQNGLTALLETLSSGAQTVTVQVAGLQPIVEESGETKDLDGTEGAGLGEDVESVTDANIPETGIIVNDVLYTLDEGDGFFEENGIKYVSLETSMSGVPDAEPGTAAFAADFKGLTILVPAGTGKISFEFRTLGNTSLMVQVGKGEPTRLLGDAGEALTTASVDYAVSEPTYIYIFNQNLLTESRELDTNRAPGRRNTGTLQLKKVSVKSSSVAVVPEPPLSPVTLGKSDITVTENHIKVTNADVASLADNVFEDIPLSLTYADLSETSITGLVVDRTALPFSNLPATAFIYLPAGNDIAAGTKNVVIGGVCDEMQLSDEGSFEAAVDFTAVAAEQARDYSSLVDKNCTIYLPFAIDATTAAGLGTFYQLKSIDGNKAVMESVDATAANTPYMFKPAVAKVSAKMVEVKTLDAAPSVGDAQFMGTYKTKSVCSTGSSNIYCFVGDGTDAGKFVRVIDTPMTVAPFRAYIEVAGGSAHELALVLDGDATAIKNIKVGTDDNVYYNLQGQRVLYPKKGLYIVNGKKVMIK